jgi:hypothetical protein
MNTFFKILTFLFFTVNMSSIMAEPTKKIADIPKSEWDKVLNQKIFFAHQSVGSNIIKGINELSEEYPWLKFNFTQSDKIENFNTPFFSHTNIGENTKPDTKTAEFKQILESDLLEKIDIAALKFCYVDFNKDTDVLKVFSRYKHAVESIRDKNPETIIIHFTVPLTTLQTGIKAWIKNIIGKPLGGFQSNIVRNQYNDFLIKEFSGKDKIFDVAKYESTLPNGQRSKYKDGDSTYYSLAYEYTDDGAHLNKKGRKYIAEKFLLFLLEYTV